MFMLDCWNQWRDFDYTVLLITVLPVLSSCDQRKTLLGKFMLCIRPKSFQLYRNVMSCIHSKT